MTRSVTPDQQACGQASGRLVGRCRCADIDEAQADVRRVYRGGFVGQLVSGTLWLIAAAVAT